VPKQGKAEQAPLNGTAQAFDRDLRHHHCQPDQSGGHVHAMAADQREERRSLTLAGGGGLGESGVCDGFFLFTPAGEIFTWRPSVHEYTGPLQKTSSD
jgi:hypothetical protein